MKAQVVTFLYEKNVAGKFECVRMQAFSARGVYVPRKFFATRDPYSDSVRFFLVEVKEDGKFAFTPFPPPAMRLPRRPGDLDVIEEVEIPNDDVNAVVRSLQDAERIRALWDSFCPYLNPHEAVPDDEVPF